MDNQDSVFAIDEMDQDIDEYGYPLDEGEEGDEEPRKRSVSGPVKDDPLDRRALLALEKQLILEEPESEFDLHVSTSASSFIQGLLIVPSFFSISSQRYTYKENKYLLVTFLSEQWKSFLFLQNKKLI